METTPFDLFGPGVPRRVKRDRMAVCLECPHFSPKTTRCGVCGCVMAAKARIAKAECPIGRWGEWHGEVV